ncbi:MAG TPA: YfiR family protein [Caulobacteraceae bacterium]|jgi:hypothetical protein|nr:YfiR family protein [Caulobacteraceae bacterium]
MLGLAIGVATAAVAGAAATSVRVQAPPTEFTLKAAYLHKLAAFVEWPASAFESATSPIEFCIAGTSPFGKLLQQAVADQRIGAHPIEIRQLERADRPTGCHVLYLAASNAVFVMEGLRSVRGTPVLTVTDSAFEGSAVGIVHFVLKDNRVRFEIDQGAATENQLVLSSKLLSLALAGRP